MTRMRFISLVSLLVLSFFCAATLSPAVHSQGSSSAPALTNDGLNKILTGMGFEPKPLTKGFLIAINRDSWTVNIQLVISANAEKIGMNANLGVVENPDAITAAQWRGLLAANEDVDPSSFYYSAADKKLYIHRVLDNHGLTAAFLREQIDNFYGNVKDTSKLWSFTK
jgi:hypothetical protein